MQQFMPDMEAEDRRVRGSLYGLGLPGPTDTRLEAGVTGAVGDAQELRFVTSANGEGARGSVQSLTEITFHHEPGDPTMIVTGKPLPGPTARQHLYDPEHDWQRAEAFEVQAYPAWIEYRRKIILRDAQGRYCEVNVFARVDMTHEAFARSIAGKPLNMQTLMAVWGEKAYLSASLTGSGPEQPYSGSYAAGEAQSIHMMSVLASDRFAILNGARDDVHPGTADFLLPSMNPGEQFDGLERFLERADELEVKRRGPVKRISLSSSDDDENSGGGSGDLSPVTKGILLGVFGLLAGIAMIFGGAALLSALIPSLTLMQSFAIVSGSYLLVQFGRSLYRRMQESKGLLNVSASGVLGAAALDTFGISSVIEAVTDESILTGQKRHRSVQERWEAGTSGLLGIFLMFLGGRAAKRGRTPVADPVPADPWAAAADSAPRAPADVPPAVQPVDASAFATPDQYLNAIRTEPQPPTHAGPAWDHTRFPNGPTARWRPGDPVDMPAADGTYPTFATGRGRFWRNQAQIELEARARGESRHNMLSTDPIKSLCDADLATLRDTATSDVRSPRDPSTGRTAEIEHFGVPQRTGRALERVGFTSSEARRLSDAANPGSLLDVSPVEHAFFDAEAHGFGRRRADPVGNMWRDTPWADPRVNRPLIYMSDAALIEIANRARTDPAIRLSNVPTLESAVRAEISVRGLHVIPF
ncbi:MAG: hypothetical protein OEY13_05115 [Gammaproteobacteria bacterium]|nr:hypothetical protein [Gammaproteobacteria bacterium]MDH5272438.1 hypothetical protein [Gammaproteobacteria bacterium]